MLPLDPLSFFFVLVSVYIFIFFIKSDTCHHFIGTNMTPNENPLNVLMEFDFRD